MLRLRIFLVLGSVVSSVAPHVVHVPAPSHYLNTQLDTVWLSE
jgi:hypothetical protein